MLVNESENVRAFRQKEGRQKDRRIDYPRVLQDFIPFGAAALLPINLNHILLKKGMETADHLLPLGCCFGLHCR